MIKFNEIQALDYRFNIEKGYENVYQVLVDDDKCKVFDDRISLFVFMVAVGYKRNIAKDILIRSDKSIHSRRITENQLSTLYAIIINDETIGKNFENFLEENFLSKCLKLIEKYAQGGMEIICDEVFEKKWNNKMLSREYDEYDVDLLRFIHTERVSSPF
ncbi:hypothetical protein G9F71_022445 [Clostridium sp. FP2]|uniref:hypothetical protein n=1 Tax=Clostridium sp. FP2 TaxID=2724481 RepID=UPI0013E96D16|nr:hypothetical protein [Clostridium sp. FP2]MBZ9625592.1 hypothetical protein [Clostridium sp. FP2]